MQHTILNPILLLQRTLLEQLVKLERGERIAWLYDMSVNSLILMVVVM